MKQVRSSFIQQYIWLDQKLDLDSPKYNTGGYVLINGSINFELLKKSLKVLFSEHDIFSFVFKETGGVLNHKISSIESLENVKYFEVENEMKGIERINNDFLIPFRIEKNNKLFKIWLLKVGEAKYIWYAKFHHLVADGYCFEILFNEINRIYLQLDRGKNCLDVAPPPISYTDFIYNEQTYVSSKSFLNDKGYWREKYSEHPSLVFQKKIKAGDNYSIDVSISALENKKLSLIAKSEKVSNFHLLVSSLSLVLSKYYRKQEIDFGIPVLNRPNKFARRLFGPVTNLFPLKMIVDSNQSFLDFVKSNKRELFSNYRHQKFHLARILKELPQSVDRLYDVRFSYEDFRFERTFAGYQSETKPLSADSEDDPISIHAMERGDGRLTFRFDINQEYVSKLEATQITQSLKYVLRNIENIKNKNIADIGIANKSQRREVIKISLGKKIKRSSETFVDRWDRIAKLKKTAIATIADNASFTYDEINIKAQNLAYYLVKNGIKRGDKIGVMITRTEKSIISILALFKIGAIYIPIDNNHPQEIKDYIIKDSKAKIILLESKNKISHHKCIKIEDVIINHIEKPKKEFPKLSPLDTAYIMYTSGTTGNPKGVVISHESLIDYVKTFSSYFGLSNKDRVLQQSSLSFDTSVEEIFPILAVGGVLVFANDTKDMQRLISECSQHKITVLSTSPYVVQFLNQNFQNYQLVLKTLISGGDVLKPDYISNLLELFNVYNTYGPTESTVCATYHKVTKIENIIPIGIPITNRNIFLLNEDILIPKGATGEIAIGGEGLAIEYLNQKELSKKSFIEFEGQRVYKSGDLGKWDKNGNLIFMGRKDHQLSYRGFRIEAEAIEKYLNNFHETINGSYVCVRELNNAPILLAYIITENSKFDFHHLSSYLSQSLPSYMVPSHYISLKALPLLSNGKISINDLPLPSIDDPLDSIKLASIAEEIVIANIWSSLLGSDKLDINTSFFELGGHSLLANQYISIIRKKQKCEITLREFYQNPTISKQASILIKNKKQNIINLLPAPKSEFYPLSFSQERLWFLSQLDENNRAYYVPRAIKMTGELNKKLLEKTFTELIRKHEILRTVFHIINGKPFQKILSPFNLQIPIISFENIEKKLLEENIKKYIFEEGNKEFNLESGPLLRLSLMKISAKCHILVLCEHHLIHDGWTQGILLREFIETYSKLKEKPSYKITLPKIQFKDFAYWQQQNHIGESLKKQLEFWKEKLEGNISELALSLDRKRPKEISGKGKLLEKTLDANFSEKLRRFSSSNNATLFITMLTAYKIILSKFSGDTDITIGTGVANRRFADIENMLGMVINTLTLRTVFSTSDSLLDILDKVKKTCMESYEYEDTPFGKVVEHLNPVRNTSVMPLFQYMFNFMNTPSRNLALPNLELEIIDSHNSSAKFDMNIVVITPFEQAEQEGLSEVDKRIIIEWEYNSDIFFSETMERMLSMYIIVLENFVDNPSQLMTELDYIPMPEKQKLVKDFNDTKVDLPENTTVVELFVKQAKKTPNNIAVVFRGEKLTYKELDEISNQLANYLIKIHNIMLEDLVGLLIERSNWMIVSLLGVLKASAAYVPIDPSYPLARINYIKRDTCCKVIIDSNLLDEFNKQKYKFAKHIKKKIVSSNALAYVIYTSGSTGKPKGVMIEHIALLNRLKWMQKFHTLTPKDSILQKTTYTFDVSVWELIWGIINGAQLVMLEPNGEKDPRTILNYINDYGITIIHFVPSMLSVFLEYLEVEPMETVKTNTLKQVFSSGEALLVNHQRKFYELLPNISLTNLYGPTEATIDVSYFECSKDFVKDPIPIGKPIDNIQLLILDQTKNLVPIGVEGELYISGAGLSRGYLNNDVLTKEKFIAHPFERNEKIYRTGDIARWLPDGNIEYKGRNDHQIKVRGIRIELGEIEKATMGYSAITKAAVLYKDVNGTMSITAYVEVKKTFDKNKLRKYLSKVIPDFMIPNYIVELDSLPLNENGKINRTALSEILPNEVIHKGYVAPRKETEKLLIEIWQNILGVEKIGVYDNFFELGGNSIQIIRVINIINERFKINLKPKNLYNTLNVEGVSEIIDFLLKDNKDKIQKSANSDTIVL